MIGTKLADRYEILSELGRGGMGVVYRAKDPVLNREVAVKLIPPGNLTKDAEERFQREAQIVAQMDHPSIVPIYDLGRHEGSLFFVMPVAREHEPAAAPPRRARCGSATSSTSGRRSPTRSTTATRAASSTATSSPRTS